MFSQPSLIPKRLSQLHSNNSLRQALPRQIENVASDAEKLIGKLGTKKKKDVTNLKSGDPTFSKKTTRNKCVDDQILIYLYYTDVIQTTSSRIKTSLKNFGVSVGGKTT